MLENKPNQIKAQEWIVKFDGQIGQSEEFIDSDKHHKKFTGTKKKEKDV